MGQSGAILSRMEAFGGARTTLAQAARSSLVNVNFVAEAQYTNIRVFAVSDGGAESSAGLDEAAQQLLLLVVGLEGETVHDLGDAVDILGDCVS